MAEPRAFVTGASRGVGRGVAVALNDAGYRVYATGRSIAQVDLPERVRRIRCDHLRDDETTQAFAQVSADGPGGLDLLVNSAWGGYEQMVEGERFTWMLPFWEQPLYRWASMMDAGVRAAFVASQHAAKMMVPQKRGLIVNISFWAAQKHIGNAIYGISKAATDKLTADIGHELRPHGVAVVSLYPGLVRTDAVMRAAEAGVFRLENSETPVFIGRVIAAMARDPLIMSRSGNVVVAAQAALEYGVKDIDGKQPAPLTFAMV